MRDGSGNEADDPLRRQNRSAVCGNRTPIVSEDGRPSVAQRFDQCDWPASAAL
jgi:hypothetical protein